MSEEGREQSKVITRRGFLTVAAATVAPVLAVLGLDRVSRIQPTTRETIDALKSRGTSNNASLEKEISERVRQKEDEAEGMTPLVNSPPTASNPTPPPNELVSPAVDGLETKPIVSTPTPISNPISNSPLQVDAGGNFGGEVNSTGK